MTQLQYAQSPVAVLSKNHVLEHQKSTVAISCWAASAALLHNFCVGAGQLKALESLIVYLTANWWSLKVDSQEASMYITPL